MLDRQAGQQTPIERAAGRLMPLGGEQAGQQRAVLGAPLPDRVRRVAAGQQPSHQTRSPGANPLPGQTAVMVPTRSRPTTNVRGIGVGYRPDRMKVSAGLTADTSTATSTTVGPGTG